MTGWGPPLWVNKVSLELVTTLRPTRPHNSEPTLKEAFLGRKMVNLEMNVVLVPMKSVVLLMWAQSIYSKNPNQFQSSRMFWVPIPFEQNRNRSG